MNRLRLRLNGQEIANILWSFATLNAQPDPALLDALSSHVYKLCNGNESAIAKVFKRQELANVSFTLPLTLDSSQSVSLTYL